MADGSGPVLEKRIPESFTVGTVVEKFEPVPCGHALTDGGLLSILGFGKTVIVSKFLWSGVI